MGQLLNYQQRYRRAQERLIELEQKYAGGRRRKGMGYLSDKDRIEKDIAYWEKRIAELGTVINIIALKFTLPDMGNKTGLMLFTDVTKVEALELLIYRYPTANNIEDIEIAVGKFFSSPLIL